MRDTRSADQTLGNLQSPPGIERAKRERERLRRFHQERYRSSAARLRRIMRWVRQAAEGDPLGERVFTRDPEQINRTLRGKVFRLLLGRPGAEGRGEWRASLNRITEIASSARWPWALTANADPTPFGGRSWSLDLWLPYASSAPFTRFWYEPAPDGSKPLDPDALARGPDRWMEEAEPDEQTIRGDLIAWAARWEAAADALIAGDAATLRVMQALEKRGGNTRWTKEQIGEANDVKEAEPAWMSAEERRYIEEALIAFIRTESEASLEAWAERERKTIAVPGPKPTEPPPDEALRLLAAMADRAETEPDRVIVPALLNEQERHLAELLWAHGCLVHEGTDRRSPDGNSYARIIGWKVSRAGFDAAARWKLNQASVVTTPPREPKGLDELSPAALEDAKLLAPSLREALRADLEACAALGEAARAEERWDWICEHFERGDGTAYNRSEFENWDRYQREARRRLGISRKRGGRTPRSAISADEARRTARRSD